MELPTEFLTLSEVLTIGGLGVVLTLIVQATKELVFLQRIPTLLYAWCLGCVLLLVGTALQTPPASGLEWGQTVYMSILNGVLVAAIAVFGHQAALRAGLLRESPDADKYEGIEQ